MIKLLIFYFVAAKLQHILRISKYFARKIRPKCNFSWRKPIPPPFSPPPPRIFTWRPHPFLPIPLKGDREKGVTFKRNAIKIDLTPYPLPPPLKGEGEGKECHRQEKNPDRSAAHSGRKRGGHQQCRKCRQGHPVDRHTGRARARSICKKAPRSCTPSYHQQCRPPNAAKAIRLSHPDPPEASLGATCGRRLAIGGRKDGRTESGHPVVDR